jgi:N-acetylglucosaminyldiphosphoundecaprenol N-acetyl-beta-D-mannosaminyltransferase
MSPESPGKDVTAGPPAASRTAHAHPSPLLSVHRGEARIFGRPVFTGDMSSFLDTLDDHAKDDVPHLAVTANVDHIIDLEGGSPLVDAYHAASLRTVDGAPLLWLLRKLGARDLHRITGADLITTTCREGAIRAWTVAIVGGADDVLEAAVRNLRAEHPRTTIVGIPAPMLGTPGDPAGREIVDALNELNPDIVFLCLGAPKQESWFLHWRPELPAAVYIGAGAAVDFAAGHKKRAPRPVQRIGLEWTWRLAQEFRRLAPRYLIKGPRFLRITRRTLRSGTEAGAPSSSTTVPSGTPPVTPSSDSLKGGS